MMTRTAIISDVHSNYLALRAVLDDIAQQNIDEIWMLGDAVGYLDAPELVLKELLDLQRKGLLTIWLAGNHDWGLASLTGLDCPIKPNGNWGDALMVLQQQMLELDIDGDLKTYAQHLLSLGYTKQVDDNIFLAHGSYYPDDPKKGMLERYVNTYRTIEEDYHHNLALWRDALQQRPVLVMYGHWHSPYLWERTQALECDPNLGPNSDFESTRIYWEPLDLPLQTPAMLEAGHLYYINVSSVGMPRDKRMPRPTYAILDSTPDSYRLLFREVSYKVEVVRAECKRLSRPDKIWQEERLLGFDPLPRNVQPGV